MQKERKNIMTKEEIKNIFDEKVRKFLKFLYKDLEVTPQIMKDLEALKRVVDNEWLYDHDTSDSEVRKRILNEHKAEFIQKIKSDIIIQTFDQFLEEFQKTRDGLYATAKGVGEFTSIAKYYNDGLWNLVKKIDFYIEYINLTKE